MANQYNYRGIELKLNVNHFLTSNYNCSRAIKLIAIHQVINSTFVDLQKEVVCIICNICLKMVLTHY